jgi:methylated-DNA-[protein]-cysteine S-methyltransferase
MNDIRAQLASIDAAGSYARAAERFLRAADDDGLLDVGWATVDSPYGALTVAVTSRGLARIAFGPAEPVLFEVSEAISPRVLESPRRTATVRRQLDEYFEGERRSFDLALDLAAVHGFRLEVLQHLGEVPYGETTTYAELAEISGRPRAFRAVGSTMATNPVPIVLPCHRVLPSSGGVGNYGGGVAMKRSLLTLEGIDPDQL